MYRIQKIMLFLILSIVVFIINDTLFFSNFANYINYHESLGEPNIVYSGLKIYFHHFTWGDYFKAAPKAFLKAKEYYNNGLYFQFLPFLVFIPFQKNEIHGSATWADMKDIKEFYQEPRWLLKALKKLDDSNFVFKKQVKNGIQSLFYSPSQIKRKILGMDLIGDEGIYIGKFKNLILRDNAMTHMYLSAPTRTGKGIAIILNTLLKWKGSTVVLDIKKENYLQTSGYRKKVLKQNILKFEPMAKDSCSYNPCLEISWETDRESDDVSRIATLLTEDPGAKDPFWGQAAAGLLSAVLIYTYYSKAGNVSFGSALDFITDPSDTLANRMKAVIGSKVKNPIYRQQRAEFDRGQGDLNNPPQEWLEVAGKPFLSDQNKEDLAKIFADPTDKEYILKGIHPAVARGFADFIGKAEATAASVLSSCVTKLQIYGTDTVRNNTSTSDFRIIDLMDHVNATSLYLVLVPEDITYLSPLVKIFITQFIGKLTRAMEFEDGKQKKYKHRLLLLLDEFPAIGKIEIIRSGIGFIAGYGIKTLLISQSSSQMNEVYGKDGAESIISNCSVQVYYTPNDEPTAQAISNRLGKFTQRYHTNKGFFSKNTSENFLARDLMTKDEVFKLPADKMVIFIAGMKAILADKVFWFTDKWFTKNMGIKPPEKSDVLR